MFKKPVDAKSQQRLSGADRKKLKRTIKERFPNVSDAEIDILLPPKGEVTVSKYPNRLLVYGQEGGFPVFFDTDGRGTEVLPSVFALWMVPELLPSFWLKGGEVSRYVLGGADLMFPGISVPPEGLPPFSAGESWTVKVPGNPAPIAVGITTMSSTEAIKAGLRGKALRICHYYGDFLWASVDGQLVPNAGFLENVVYGDPSLSSTSEAHGSCESDDGVEQQKDDVAQIIELQSGTDAGSKNVDVERVINEIAELEVAENSTTDELSNREHQSSSTEEMDLILDKCLLQALHKSIKEKDLPIPGSTFWSNHVLPCRPSDITLDIKKSSHKKLSKWLQSKASTGLISVKEDKHKKEVILSSVNRNHPDYTSFKPEKRVVEKTEQTSSQTSGNEGNSNKKLELEEIYKPSTHVNPIFASVGADKGNLYSASEATEIVFSYVEKENLVKPTNKAVIVLDAILCDALFKGSIKKGSSYPTEIHKKDLGSTFLNRMQAHHRVTRGNESVVCKGGLKTVQIMTERRQGNKKVTKLTGLESFLMDPEAVASELQKKFACSTTVAELPGKKGLEVLIQGGVIDGLGIHLVEHYGIPKRYIEVMDKTKK
ncbi:eukaryotic translation initiation factor 2D [Impatiens glandulifera]|uniref:eukaryotic translation initiation factor 2D n=1 Tax=Impatiens glandulifera TaxID=253017 RepID=UPI001FB0FC16|nr:eukaryotic translation initiation factor 2D [Impatiens glandulifera]